MTSEQLKAIEELYIEIKDTLYVFFYTRLKDKPLSEEAVQDTFRIACSKPSELLASENMKGWIMQTAKYVYSNIIQRQRTMNRLIVSAYSAEDFQLSSSDDDAFRIMYADLLGEEDFEILEKVAVQKYTAVELAQELGISVEACHKRIQRAKKKARRKIKNT